MSAARAAGLLAGVAAESMLGSRPELRAATSGRNLPALGGLLVAGLVAERLGRRRPLLQFAGTAAATWAVLGGASVAADGAAMARALDAGDLSQARMRLPLLSRFSRNPGGPASGGSDSAGSDSAGSDGAGSDSAGSDGAGSDGVGLDGAVLARAAVESVASSTAHAMVGPLLWGAVAGVPGLLGYRAVMTLPYVLDGQWRSAAAVLDDLVNLVPARAAALLTTLCAPVVGGSAPGAWEVWRRDRALHPDPNAGQVESAFAGALEIRLGGRTVYPDGSSDGAAERPVLGHGRTPDAGDVTRGVELSRVVGVAAAAGSAVLAALVGARRRRRS